MTPNKERIKLWVEALRSGKYQQGRRALRTLDNKYCCLGVACEVYREQTGDGDWREADEYVSFHPSEGNKGTALLPSAVQKWFGLRESPFVGHDPLTYLNDREGCSVSFRDLANLIEQGVN